MHVELPSLSRSSSPPTSPSRGLQLVMHANLTRPRLGPLSDGRAAPRPLGRGVMCEIGGGPPRGHIRGVSISPGGRCLDSHRPVPPSLRPRSVERLALPDWAMHSPSRCRHPRSSRIPPAWRSFGTPIPGAVAVEGHPLRARSLDRRPPRAPWRPEPSATAGATRVDSRDPSARRAATPPLGGRATRTTRTFGIAEIPPSPE